MASVSSLSQLHSSAQRLVGKSLLLPVDEEFVQTVHCSPPGAHCNDGGSVHAAYEQLLARTRKGNTGPPPGVPKAVFSYAADAVISSRANEFMGPLCSPMRKSHAAMLQKSQYLVTEKSDGTRVVLVSLLAPMFPRWYFREMDGGPPRSLRLDDAMTLERMRLEFSGSNAPVGDGMQLQLSLGLYRVEAHNEKALNSDGEVFVLNRCTDASSEVVSGLSSVSVERRLGPRHMAYCFDRSMERAYLLLDEYGAPSLISFAIDGELMVTVKKEARLLFGCFDVFRYAQQEDAVEHDMCLARWSMSKRYAALKEIIINPIHASLASAAVEPSLQIFAKEMLPLEKFSECLSRLQRHEVDDNTCGVVYYYDGPYGLTKSDGFIFTPEKFDLVQGASKEQLKWKWPSMLSVDWSLTAVEGRKNDYMVDLFFRKKRFGHRPDSVGRVRLSSAMRLLNPHSLVVPTTSSIVAECVFDHQHKCWLIERLRSDKSEPNSVVTVISVLESLVEDITLRVLLDIIGVNGTLPTECVQSLEKDISEKKEGTIECISEPPYEKKTCQLTLRATQLQTQGEHEIHLYWSVRLHSEKQHIPCVHCKLSECMGLGFRCPAEDPTSKLTECLYIALANAGGSYAWSDFTVDVVFDGEAGRWKIVAVQPNGENRKSTGVSVIQHLQYLLVCGREKTRLVAESTTEEVSCVETETQTNALVQQINAHYACKTKELSSGKDRSVLRQFNNWVKSVLISTAVSYVQLHCNNEVLRDRLAVADLCAGRGGDLFKWRAHKPQALFMADSCLEAIAEAAGRYCVSKGLSVKVVPNEKNHPGFPAYFCVCDAFDETGEALTVKFDEFFKKHLHDRRLDMISCQFSIHYGCSSEERMRGFLRAVSTALRPGGVFIGTTVNDMELLRRAREHGSTFGNGVYKVVFPSDANLDDSFGVEYSISVESSVSELPEYIVPWERFVALCMTFGLQLVETFGFVEYSGVHYNSTLGQELRDTIGGSGKRDLDGHVLLRLSSEEMEAAALFRTFFFVRN
ncbi:methyltransferase [Trypanosoma grayi]|uniref:methyltransferase n=1 Tax=Trypanosoma grayi TaxID=71804 RepID=UPI0004F471DE|nr:methyltransferase [Trypanosoma grayi]KEG10728.1 methyltransferase [Trypanosoma grayi]